MYKINKIFNLFKQKNQIFKINKTYKRYINEITEQTSEIDSNLEENEGILL